MNPYNSIWTGTRGADGPEEFHVVLLDNGRTDVLADPESRETLHCIRCAACLNACPVYRQTGGHAYGSIYSGPIGAILTPQLQSMEHSTSLPYASSLCGACYEVCPVKINIPEILIHLRRRIVEADRPRGRGAGDEARRRWRSRAAAGSRWRSGWAGWRSGRSSTTGSDQRRCRAPARMDERRATCRPSRRSRSGSGGPAREEGRGDVSTIVGGADGRPQRDSARAARGPRADRLADYASIARDYARRARCDAGAASRAVRRSARALRRRGAADQRGSAAVGDCAGLRGARQAPPGRPGGLSASRAAARSSSSFRISRCPYDALDRLRRRADDVDAGDRA